VKSEGGYSELAKEEELRKEVSEMRKKSRQRKITYMLAKFSKLHITCGPV